MSELLNEARGVAQVPACSKGDMVNQPQADKRFTYYLRKAPQSKSLLATNFYHLYTFIYPTIHPSTHSLTYPLAHTFVCPFIYSPSKLSIHLPSTHPSIIPSIHPSTIPHSIHSPIHHPFIHPANIYPSTELFIYLCISQAIYPYSLTIHY